MKILIAEDDKFLASAYKVKFAKAGYEVFVAQDGEETLEKIPEFKPDLILLDLIMPKLDGFGVLKRLQENGNTIPVVIASNLGQQEDIDRGLSLGAKDFIVKSNMSMEDITEKISAYVKVQSDSDL